MKFIDLFWVLSLYGIFKFIRFIFYDGMIEFTEEMCWENSTKRNLPLWDEQLENRTAKSGRSLSDQRKSDFLMVLSGETDLLARSKLMFESPMLAFMREFSEKLEIGKAQKTHSFFTPPPALEIEKKKPDMEWDSMDECLSILSEQFILDFVAVAEKTTFSRMDTATLA